MLGLVLHPLALLLLMWIVARHDAEFSFFTTLLVVVGVGVCAAVLGILHPLLGLVGYIVLLPLALVRFCYLSLPQASIVTGLFLVWLIAFHAAVEAILT